MSKLAKLNNEMQNYVNVFNTVSKNIAAAMIAEFPGDMYLTLYHQIVLKFIKNNPEEPISIFCNHIYGNDSYRRAILNSDETFFKSNQHEKLTSSDADRIRAMFQFKDWWDKMSASLQEYIKQEMRKLIKLCEKYIELNCDYNDLIDSLKKK